MSTSTDEIGIRERIAKYIDPAQIARIKATYDERVDAARTSPSLSDHGRKVAVAKAHRERREGLTKLRDSLRAQVDKERASIETRLYGPGVVVDPMERVAHRDALQRAAGLSTQPAALEALRQARFSGDDALARAVTYRAAQMGWTEAIDAQEAAKPGTLADIDAIRDLPNADESITAGTIFGNPVPEEFRGIGGSSDREIDRWAELDEQ